MVVAVMEAHPRSLAVQENAAGALRNFALSERNAIYMWEAGAVAALLNTVERHPMASPLNEVCCLALGGRSLLGDARKGGWW